MVILEPVARNTINGYTVEVANDVQASINWMDAGAVLSPLRALFVSANPRVHRPP